MRLYHTLLLLAIILAGAPATSMAEPPLWFTYQARLLDDAGDPFEGSVDLTYLLYDIPVGGTALWSEGQSVSITDGMLEVELGKNPGNPLDVTYFRNDDLYLAVEVYGEEVYREKLLAGAFAIYAAEAEQADLASDAQSLQGLGPEAFSPASHMHVPADITLQGHNGGLDADYVDGAHAAMLSGWGHQHWDLYAELSHTHPPADISPQGHGSGLDARYLDGRQVDDFATLYHFRSAGDIISGNLSPYRFNSHTEMTLSGRLDASGTGDLFDQAYADANYAPMDHEDLTPWAFHFVTLHGGVVIAFGAVRADGTLASGHGNILSSWNATYYRYEITLVMHSYHLNDYTTLVTPAAGGSNFVTASTSSMSGQLLVYLRQHD